MISSRDGRAQNLTLKKGEMAQVEIPSTSHAGITVPMPSTMRSTLRSARLTQIRRVSALVTALQRFPRIASFIRAVRSWFLPRKVLELLVGYRRLFESIAEASDVAAGYIDASHDCAANIDRQIEHGRAARLSDYPVLFYFRRLIPEASNLFDLGGNVGNLFYCYSTYLDLPQEFVWCVHDRKKAAEVGRSLAHERCETRLSFTNELEAMNGTDILLVSGALHYFESSLPEILRGLSQKPQHVFVNRTPMTTVKSVVTVQDDLDSLYACKTIHREELVNGMIELEYDVVDGWSIPGLSVRIPFHPEYSVAEYSGLYFRLKKAKHEAVNAS